MTDFDAIPAAARALLDARGAVALTGAGISVPSGIPDFRSPQGLWTRYDINEFGTIQAFLQDPYKVWRLFRELGEVVGRAAPNPAHEALARLEEWGILQAVVTQNIDLLHQRAGSRRVIEFHGAPSNFTCLACQSRFSREQADTQRDGDGIPHCTCGYPLKPDIVLFGESIPEAALRESFELAQQADTILVVGTSATVAPASVLPSVVLHNGGTVIEMNLTHTELSNHAQHRVIGDVARTLPRLVEEIEHLRNR